MRSVVVQHVPFEGPGLIAPALFAVGSTVSVVRADLGDALPTASQLDVLVVMGGPMGALDDHEHPHLAQVRSLIADCVLLGKPVLGVCLGAQLLAAALGATVRRGPVAEIGAGVVEIASADDPVLSPSGSRIPVVHWHEDTFDLPEGAELLARSGLYAHQAFRVGTAYGLQFHVEIGSQELWEITPHLPADKKIALAEIDVVESVGVRVLERWAAFAAAVVKEAR
ncbi:type 1 glutamine amidotransferase [Lentzea sp.]|uniref:type 1 glutamine amidotransferase n=1 Tax=Lentzea sp. TaxID=56099 RepID=UPI002C6693F5|nr:type 1 glutamine amidotransferase [Lentzea sp.]HUQ56947.1 type 1 glutamine amidotransferase [Lentzea sp.]